MWIIRPLVSSIDFRQIVESLIRTDFMILLEMKDEEFWIMNL